MSETVAFNADTASQGGAPAPDGGAEPAATEATAPATNGAATENDTTQQPEEPKPNRADRRFAVLTARLAAQQAELEALRQASARQAPQQALPQTPEELERLVEARGREYATQQAAAARAEAFHEQGRAAYADWQDRCQSLMQMGADAGFAQLLVEMPDGARVAASLAEDPDEIERIAGLKTERARAIALGKYAATLPAATPAAAPRRQVSRAPAPIRPVTGTANPAPNEYAMTPEQLVDYYSRQAMEQRMKASR